MESYLVSIQCSLLTFKCYCYANSYLTLVILRNSHKNQGQLLEKEPAQTAGPRNQ